MELSERKKTILTSVVEEYIRTAEPVGSKTIAQISDLNCSTATIRNELAELVAHELSGADHFRVRSGNDLPV